MEDDKINIPKEYLSKGRNGGTLCNFAKIPKELASECGKKGGKRSGEVKREKKLMKEKLEDILKMSIKKGRLQSFDNLQDAKGKNIDVETAILIAQILKAVKGDTVAATFIRDTSGQKPDDNLNVEANVPVIISGETELED